LADLGQAFDYCLTTLRGLDRDRYLAALLMPEDIRRDMAALYLFNAEIARIRDLVHEPIPGEIRLQFWRDLFEKGGGGNAGPLAAALFDVVERHNLPRHVFVNMLDARTFDLYDDPMEGRTAFEGYAGETASALIQLGLLVTAPSEAAALAEAAGHAGVAQAAAGALLMMPLHVRRGQIYLPADMLSAAGLDRDGFLKQEDKARIDAAIELFTRFALEHLSASRAAMNASGAAFFPFLPAALAEPVLKKALKAKAGLISDPLALGQMTSQWRLWRAARESRI
jgi:phytoene synthase